MKSKGLQELLQEDVSLLKKVTYEEYSEKKLVPPNGDWEVEKAYEAYQELEKQWKKSKA